MIYNKHLNKSGNQTIQIIDRKQEMLFCYNNKVLASHSLSCFETKKKNSSEGLCFIKRKMKSNKCERGNPKKRYSK